ncbi:MAG: hypothetical protein LBI74_06695 [Synergistaceae bacterium]|nr:hypothetical protein [Synergistaceae bacterium]
MTNGSVGYRNGFTSGGTPIKIERVTAIADDELLLLWHDFYDEDAEYEGWLPSENSMSGSETYIDRNICKCQLFKRSYI